MEQGVQNKKTQTKIETMHPQEEPKQGSKKRQNEEIKQGMETILISNSQVPKVEEEWGNKLWEVVRKTQQEVEDKHEPPLKEIDFDQKTLKIEIKVSIRECKMVLNQK